VAKLQQDVEDRADKGVAAMIGHIRERVGARVENTSLRNVAREIGMSPAGLKKFLQGTAPHSPTLRRLRNWYVQYVAASAGDVSEPDASAALAVLVHDLTPDARRRIAGEVLDTLARGYETSGKTRPDWFSGLRAQYGGEEVGSEPVSARRSAFGKYAHISGSSDDFARRKQAEIDLEDGRAA
jgi:hypothetical protein